jgi:hypothetical protein
LQISLVFQLVFMLQQKMAWRFLNCNNFDG